MRNFLFSAFLILLGLLILLFLLANRQLVYISLDPIDPADPAIALGPMPLWAALMVMMVVGYILGGIGMWLTGKGTRRKASERKVRIRELEHEIAMSGTPRAKDEPVLPTIQRPSGQRQPGQQESGAGRPA